VSDPSQAFMAASTRELMWQLTECYPVIVITGRGQSDALRRVRSVGVLEVVGNHGIAPGHAARRFVDQVQRWRPAIDACVAQLPGVSLEIKDYSVALHYRHADDPDRAREAIMALASSLPHVRVIGGKEVVNLVPQGAPDKGAALIRERTRLGCDCAIYVGDDETDEDVFVRSTPGSLLGISVGERSASAAQHFIAGQGDIDRLISLLLSLRSDESYARRRGRAPYVGRGSDVP
jgi:trehalose 6-phosphate phosphatase